MLSLAVWQCGKYSEYSLADIVVASKVVDTEASGSCEREECTANAIVGISECVFGELEGEVVWIKRASGVGWYGVEWARLAWDGLGGKAW